MRVLLTGGAGFAGRWLAAHLTRQAGTEIFCITRTGGLLRNDVDGAQIQWRQADMTDAPGMAEIVAEVRPDAVVHLAAQASVAASWSDPWSTFEQNVRGQQNLFQAILGAGLRPRILIVSSNEVYGAPSLDELPARETLPLRPNNPYAVSKAAQDLMARQYVLSHGLDVVVARPFNHVGPGQRPTFVIPSLAQRIAEIEAGLRPNELYLGNMAAQRDFTDVRDVVAAYAELLVKGRSGEVYNVCSGRPRSIQDVLDLFLTLSTVHPRQITDLQRFRPADTPIMFGDAGRLRVATGWEPRVSLKQTLFDILVEARRRVSATASGTTNVPSVSAAGKSK